MLKKHDFFDSQRNKEGHGFDNKFETKIIKSNKVVIDNASGLMWQQSGSPIEMNYEYAKKYIDKLRKKGLAGYNDWRLPTREEAMSLMESEKNKKDLYINSKFAKTQYVICTANWKKQHPVLGVQYQWVVLFHNGYCSDYSLDYPLWCYVRAVRSGQSSQE